MKKKIAIAVLAIGTACAAWANCVTNTTYHNGRATTCTTCCYGNNCTTTCF